MKESMQKVRELEKQLFGYSYAMRVIDFDSETIAPEDSNDGRAEAMEFLSRQSFDLLVNDRTAALLKAAAADAEYRYASLAELFHALMTQQQFCSRKLC